MNTAAQVHYGRDCAESYIEYEVMPDGRVELRKLVGFFLVPCPCGSGIVRGTSIREQYLEADAFDRLVADAEGKR